MTIDRGYFQAPLKVSEVSTFFGVSTSVSSICKADGVNKWAIYKPVRVNSNTPITLTQRKSINMGLQPKSITKLYTSNGLATATIAEVEAQIAEWTYNKPYGTSTSQCRMSDFLNLAVASPYLGYDHNAMPSDGGWNDCRRAGGDEMPDSPYPSDIQFRINEETGANIGNADSHHMPLTCVIDTTNWYLGFAVYLSSKGAFGIIIGTKSLGEATSSNIGQVLPSFSTNTYLKSELGNVSSVTCIPILVKNPQTKQTTTAPTLTYIEVNKNQMSTQDMYCVPSGGKHYTLAFNYYLKNSTISYTDTTGTKSGYLLSGDGVIIKAGTETMRGQFLLHGFDNYAGGFTQYGWFIARIKTGTTTSGFELYQIVVVYAERTMNDTTYVVSKPSKAYSVNNTGYYYYTDAPSYGQQATTFYEYKTISRSVSASTTFSLGGVTCYGATITSEPSLKLIASTSGGTRETIN